MTVSTLPQSGPRLVRFARALGDAIDRVVEDEPLFLSAAEKTEALVLVETGVQRLQGLRLKLLGNARKGEDVCEAGAHRDAADLMSGKTKQDRAKWSREQRLATALEERWSATRGAVLAGEISVEHARVIAKVLDDLGELPEVYAEHVDAEVLARAEAHLVGLASEHNPATLRKLAAHLFEAIAPEAAEEIEARKLAAMEQRAEKAMGVVIKRDVAGIEGLTEIRLRVPDAIADRFTTYLQAFTNPRVAGRADEPADEACRDQAQPLVPFASPDGLKIPQSRRLAMGFCHLMETLDPTRLPIHGGDATHVIVTIGLDQLRNPDAAADHGLGQDSRRISASQARRLACTAKLIPAVLGGDSEVLDLGRSQRLFSRAQRRAMAIRDQQCRAEDCTIPATWCEAHHHGVPWAAGGQTDLDDGVLLCSWHHHRAHDDRYLHQLLPNGDIRYARRT